MFARHSLVDSASQRRYCTLFNARDKFPTVYGYPLLKRHIYTRIIIGYPRVSFPVTVKYLAAASYTHALRFPPLHPDLPETSIVGFGKGHRCRDTNVHIYTHTGIGNIAWRATINSRKMREPGCRAADKKTECTIATRSQPTVFELGRVHPLHRLSRFLRSDGKLIKRTSTNNRRVTDGWKGRGLSFQERSAGIKYARPTFLKHWKLK